MGIQKKFLVSSVVVVALMLAAVGGGFLSLLQVQGNAELRRQEARDVLGLMIETHGHWNRADEAYHELLVLGFSEERLRTLVQAIGAYDDALEPLLPSVGQPSLRESLLEGREFGTQLMVAAEEAAVGGSEPVMTVLENNLDSFHRLDQEIDTAMFVLFEQANAEEAEAASEVADAMHLVETFAFAMLGIVVVVIGGQFVVIIRPIIRSVQDLMKGAGEIGSGNLDHRLNLRTGDEIERLGQEFNTMAEKLGSSYRSLELAKDQIQATSIALKNEMEKGRQLQLNFLPDALPKIPGWDLAASLSPAKDVSGDFYDSFMLPNGHVCLVIGDVCDKGVGSALFMALSRSLLRIHSGQMESEGLVASSSGSVVREPLGASPSLAVSDQPGLADVVRRANDYIATTHSETNMFTTLFVGYLEPSIGVLTYINAGHEAPVILGGSGAKTRLTPTGPAIGLFPGLDFEAEAVTFEPGDTLVTYTDGVTDARNATGERFGEETLLQIFEQPISSAQGCVDEIEKQVRAHIGDAVQFDDITLLVARLADSASASLNQRA